MFFSKILDFLYKKSCLICHSKKENSFLCSNCREKIELNSPKPLKYIDGVKIYSCCLYSGVAQKMVRLLKFHKKKSMAEEITKLSFKYLSLLDEDFSDCEIVSIPLHREKHKKRGFNQCEIISLELSKLLNIPVNFNLIKRIKNTKPMYKLKITERKENLKNAFSVNKEEYHNKKLLIIDDITTTGTTLEEVIKELKNNNINDIVCFTFTNTEKNCIFIK